MGKVADLSEKRLEPRGGKPVRARQEPDALTFERETNGLSGSGTNLNEAVQPTYLEAGIRAILWLEQSGRQRFAP